MKTYTINTLCSNCGDKGRYEIEYGKGVGWAICEVCGCGSLAYDDRDDPRETKKTKKSSKKL